jgi:hypothetical protein
MNSATRIVTIVFRFVAVGVILWLAYTWLSYLLTPTLEVVSTEMNRIHQMRLEGMLRTTVVMTLSGVVLYLLAPFLARVVTRGTETPR